MTPNCWTALERMAVETDRAAEILRRVRDFVQKTGPCVSAISVNDLVQEAVMINSLETQANSGQDRL